MKLKLNAETIIAALAFFVSLLSLFYTIQQISDTRRHNRLSVEPHLTFRWDEDHEKQFYGLKVKNTDIGPARIKSFSLAVDGKIVAKDYRGGWDTVLDQFKAVKQVAKINVDWFETGDGLSPQESIQIFKISLHTTPPEKAVTPPSPTPIVNQNAPLTTTFDFARAVRTFVNPNLFAMVGEELSRIRVTVEYESLYGETIAPVSFQYKTDQKTILPQSQ